ncbi:hypothetical protein [Pseudogracilibacillus sp. SO30301A]|uniref:hypothetical protein n=1 Tax=Pseudogracilibacillus sp. SO30301A TaxID=3098291 RepID=UPI00300DEBE3
MALAGVGLVFIIPFLAMFVYFLIVEDEFKIYVISVAGLTFIPIMLIKVISLAIQEIKLRQVANQHPERKTV